MEVCVFSRGELELNLEKNYIELKLCTHVYICFMDHKKPPRFDHEKHVGIFILGPTPQY